jgi:HEAT repeats
LQTRLLATLATALTTCFLASNAAGSPSPLNPQCVPGPTGGFGLVVPPGGPARGPSSSPGGGGARPGSPAGAGPASPIPGGPGPGRPTGAPSSPLAPGVLPNPYTVGGEAISDPTAWQLWWEFNKDVYLNLPSIDTRGAVTGSSDYYLGLGQRAMLAPGGRADIKLLEQAIMPDLMSIVRVGGDVGLMREAVVAMAKASRRTDAVGFWTTLKYLVENNPNAQVQEVAALAFGIMGSSVHIDLLIDLAADNGAGRKVVEDEVVAPDLRAFAVYGLAMVGEASTSDSIRAQVVAGLARVALDPKAPEDLRAACVMGVGLVPLQPVEGSIACTCGKCEVGEPGQSFEDQVSWVYNRLLDRKESVAVRAQATGALARLLSNRPKAVSNALRAEVIDVLVDSLDQSARLPNAIRHGAVLGLSMLGDADNDHLDGWVRWALARSVRTGDRLERRWALIGLGLVGSRPGSGDEPFAGADQARDYLMLHLSKGRKSERPWAALALGVMGHWLLHNDQVLDEDVSTALRAGVRNRRRADEAGAYALAVGLRRDASAAKDLLADFEKIRDPLARGHIALALGLSGAREALPALQAALAAKRSQAALRSRAGLALGLLADREVVPALLELLKNEELGIRVGAAQALGFIGDSRGAKALGKLVKEEKTDLILRREAVIALGRMSDDRPLPWRAVLAVGTNYVSCPATLANPGLGGALNLN